MGVRTIAQGIAALIVLVGCSSPQRLATDQQLQQIRAIEVIAEVPPNNFVYLQNGTTVYAQPPVGMSVGTGVAINVVANLVVAGIEYAMTATAREAQGPVGNSVQDLDLRGTTFSHLKALSAGVTDAPSLTLSTQPFPKVELPPVPQAELNAPPGSTPKRTPVDPMQPLIDRAKASESDATLYVKLLPLFRGANGSTTLQSVSWLYDKSGQLLFSWNATFVGPAAPDVARAEVVRWWAEGRYRRFIAQGIRAVVLPMAEDITNPSLRAKRQADMERSLTPKTELRDPIQPRPVQVQDSTANAMRMRSTVCAVESDDKHVIYRYERMGRGTNLSVSAYCPGETLDLWTQDLVPGMSWLSEPMPAPGVVTNTAK